MSTQLQAKLPSQTQSEQRFVLTGIDWQQFKAIQNSFDNVPGVRLTYLDYVLEFMTIREPHEVIRAVLIVLIAIYAVEMGIEIYDTGSATQEAEKKGASFEPDLSYFINGTEGKQSPDLAFEVIFTSGSINKLEKYKRFDIAEVWFWQNEKLSLYRLHEGEYRQISQSEFFPNLDISLLEKCSLIHLTEKSMNKAIAAFREGLTKN